MGGNGFRERNGGYNRMELQSRRPFRRRRFHHIRRSILA